MKLIKSVVLGLMRGYGRGQMSERRRSHFFLFPFFFFLLFFDFLRPPGITGLIAGGLVGDGFGAEASVVVAAADGASAAGAGASAVVVASALVSDGFGGAGASAVAAAGAGTLRFAKRRRAAAFAGGPCCWNSPFLRSRTRPANRFVCRRGS